MAKLPRVHKLLYDDVFQIAKVPERFTYDNVLEMLSVAFNPKVVKLARLEPKSALKFPSKPSLPPKTSQHDYTLLLDLDETLVHYVDDEPLAMLNVRPQCIPFL